MPQTRHLRILPAVTATVAVAVFFALPVFAAASEAEARDNLWQIYLGRADLKQAFRPDDWTAVPSSKTKGLADLEDWARRYGCREYPSLLSYYAPAAAPAAGSAPTAAAPVVKGPVLKDGAVFNFRTLRAKAVYVMDPASGEALLARNSRVPWPIASITKLMTAMVALDHKTPFGAPLVLSDADDVGGVKLRVAAGSRITVRDAFNAMLIGSANDCAHAVARSSGLAMDDFVAAMNAKASALGLTSTKFVEPTGLDARNVSTPEEVARMALQAFDGYYDIRRSASSAYYDIALDEEQVHRVKNTNSLLTDDKNGLYVMGGKTGYIDESLWNVVVKMKDYRNRPIVVAVFGSGSQAQVFKDAAAAAKWVWANYRWTAN